VTTRYRDALIMGIVLMCLAPGGQAAGKKELSALGCMLQPSKQVEVSSPVPGVLELVSVRRGDIVEAGNILFQLKAGVEKAGVELARVKNEFARQKRVCPP